jgi:hypothetical protein
MVPKDAHDQVVRRACLPEILFSDDLALALGLYLEEADATARQFRLGPYVLVRGRPAILKRDFLQAVARRTAAPADDREVLP